ncbi:MAG TPA: YncE family protein [Streptosporangiaceae bacterium]
MPLASDQAEQLRDALAGAVSAGGTAVLFDPGRLGGLIPGLLPEEPQLASALVSAAEVGITRSLANLVHSGMTADEAMAFAAASLQLQTQLPLDVCTLIVRELKTALGLDPPRQATTIQASRPRSRARRLLWTALISAGALIVIALVVIAVNPLGGPRVIHVGLRPLAMVVTPDGRTLYVANADSGTVTPITIATGKSATPIPVGEDPCALAVTPDGRTLYAGNADVGTVTPVDIATGEPGAPIQVGNGVGALAVTPDGRTLYVASGFLAGETVIPVDVATGEPGVPIAVGRWPQALAVTPDGRTLYVAVDGGQSPDAPGEHKVTPINVATGTPGTAITVGQGPLGLAVTPDGRTLYVANVNDNTVTPITVDTNALGSPIRVASTLARHGPLALVVTPDGRTLYVANDADNTVAVVSLNN